MVKSYIKTNGEIESDIQHIESIIQEINNNGTLQITLITKNIVEDISRLEGWLSEIK
ncbi:8979_t:CDS:1, partial [Entrophospora sp. SA101]